MPVSVQQEVVGNDVYDATPKCGKAGFADSSDVGVESQSTVDDHAQRLDHRLDR